MSLVGECSGQTEVAYFQLQRIRQEEVAQLEIPVNHFVLMDILQSLQQLCEVVLYLGFGEDFSAFEELVEGLRGGTTTLLVQSSSKI